MTPMANEKEQVTEKVLQVVIAVESVARDIEVVTEVVLEEKDFVVDGAVEKTEKELINQIHKEKVLKNGHALNKEAEELGGEEEEESLPFGGHLYTPGQTTSQTQE